MKFVTKQTLLITDKMPRSLSKLRLHNDETFCWNKSATSERFLVEADKKADNELLAQSNLAKDSVLVESTKKNNLVVLMLVYNITFFQINLLLFINNHGGEATKKSYCEPSNIKNDESTRGILGRGGFGTVRVRFLKHYGTVAVKFNRYSGSDVEINNNEKLHQRNCSVASRKP